MPLSMDEIHEEEVFMGSQIGFHVDMDGSVSSLLPRVKAALDEAGFGVLTEIDVQGVLKKKIGAEFRPYVILGACSPKDARDALTTDPDVGLLLPCNVVLYEIDSNRVRVSAVNPMSALGVLNNPSVEPVAARVSEKLKAMVSSL